MTEKTAVILPCYKVKKHVLEVISSIGPDIDAIYVVDDACPEKSGAFVKESCKDPRVRVLFNERNLGVGGAVKHGYWQAAQDGFTYLVKMDGDGQMDASAIARLIKPLREGVADYTKGNRFFNPRFLRGMPRLRVFGNGVLSFLTKLSSGYWNVMDPTNGFTAIHAKVLLLLEPEKIDDRYFFETDMLCRLHIINAVVKDVPIPARYQDEKSNLKISRVAFSFPFKHLNRFYRRIVYDYFVHDFNVGSAELLFGGVSMLFGVIFGLYHWLEGMARNVPTETGRIMMAVLPTIIGFQLLLSALQYDIVNRNHSPIHKCL